MSRKRQMPKSKRGELRSRRAGLGEIVHQLDRESTHRTPQTSKHIERASHNTTQHRNPQPYKVTAELTAKSRDERMDVLHSLAEAAVGMTRHT